MDALDSCSPSPLSLMKDPEELVHFPGFENRALSLDPMFEAELHCPSAHHPAQQRQKCRTSK